MKYNHLSKVNKTVIQSLLIILFLWITVNCQLILHNTDRIFRNYSLYFDCLNYYHYREILAYQELSDAINELIPYCLRPADDSDNSSFEIIVDSTSQKLSFEELDKANITALHLLLWSIPIEIAEQYQAYLNEPNIVLNEYIYNCTPPRFGHQCQYSFSLKKDMSFKQIVETDFRNREPYSELLTTSVQIPCYVLLPCHRNGQLWCLDWREICDGKIDCFDEKLDEEFCFEMEINECREDEYRCHNGLCISEDLWEDGFGDTDCLDRSDRVLEIIYTFTCFQDPTFRCEEHSCKRTHTSFSCGDGQCVLKFDRCKNGRHTLLTDSMTTQGNLTYECWIAMICSTRLLKKSDEYLCEAWKQNKTIPISLQQCEPLFQFPTVPVYSNHVILFYENVYSTSIFSDVLEPNYICYDQQLCDLIIPDLTLNNLTCFNYTDANFFLDIDENPWVHLLVMIEEEFHSCSLPNSTLFDNADYINHPSLYKCENSSKQISKHRIKDEIYDCFYEDDENDDYTTTCQLDDRYRVRCRQTSICWSPLVKNRACVLINPQDAGKILFQNFCDGMERYYYDNNEQKHSDEHLCQDWLCDNMYTRCDGFWTCPDGRDEYNCDQSICPKQTFACISPVNYTLICLNSTFVNDKNVDCFGALDEQRHCRFSHPSREIFQRFQCWDSYQCLRLSQLCDKTINCPQADDEDSNVCEYNQLTCDQRLAHKHTDVEKVFCGLEEVESRQMKYFSVYTSSNYPIVDGNIITDFNSWPEKHQSIWDKQIPSIEKNSWPWYCNRGLTVQIIGKDNNTNRACLCPPSYYGHRCQYQSQRIGLTLRLSSTNRHATYNIITMLIDDNDQQQDIEAYDQFVYITKETCTIKLNRYLLFSTRPKNMTKIYSIRIDIFEKNALTFVGSWYFPIPFPFLPVNRLSISINLTNHILQYVSACSFTCYHGQCLKYINRNYSFCRCYANWTGLQCNIPIESQTCSSDSIGLGSSKNGPICVCPINKFGPRCLLTSACPDDACQNNGQCIPADITIPGTIYTCLCSHRFFGHNCEHEKARLDVAINDITMPTYLVAYFFTLSNKSDPIETTILRKLTLFQHIVTFYIAIPYQLVFIQANHKYYLATLQQSPMASILTSINPRQECISINQLLNSTILNMVPYQRIIYFHFLCYTYHNLTCFVDENYLCLCTNEHHANCMEFNSKRNFFCSSNDYCMNDGQCLQDHPTCPSTKICLCRSCFFGNRCQFYAKGLGSTLDEILGYEFQRHRPLSKQPLTVKISAAITMIIFILGLISSILTIIIFSMKESLQIGCGIYILASAITSLCTIILFTVKFWFLFYSHQNGVHRQTIFFGNCFIIEPLLKYFLYLDGWLNACVAIDRTATAIQGTSRNRNLSKKIAKCITLILFVVIACMFIPQIMHLQNFYDEAEERSWCVITYKNWLIIYSTFWIFFHYFTPVIINIVSITCVLRIAIRQQARFHTQNSWWKNVRKQLRKHRHLLISSTTVVLLTLPHLMISIILDCRKSSNLFWFYLFGYFLSFLPAASVFLIFVLSSSFYRKKLTNLIEHIMRRLRIWQINSSKL